MQNTARVKVEEKRVITYAHDKQKEMTLKEWLEDGEPLPQGFRDWNMAYWFWYSGREIGFATKKYKQSMGMRD